MKIRFLKSHNYELNVPPPQKKKIIYKVEL